MHRSIVIAVALLASCGDKQLEQLRDIKDEVCDCKTAACATEAMKKVPKGNLESTRKMQRVAHDMMECTSKLMDKERVTTDPDADVPPPAPGSGSAAP